MKREQIERLIPSGRKKSHQQDAAHVAQDGGDTFSSEWVNGEAKPPASRQDNGAGMAFQQRLTFFIRERS